MTAPPLYQFTYTPPPSDDIADMVNALIDAYLTPAALARALGVGRPTLYDWRRGATPRPETLARIEQLYSHLVAWETAV